MLLLEKDSPLVGLNESPSEKEGKSTSHPPPGERSSRLNESPSEKEGKCRRD